MLFILKFMDMFCNFHEGKILLDNSHAGAHQFSVRRMTPRDTN